MCEKCRLRELLDRELERWEVYHGSKALANALHIYAIERRDRVIAEAREKEDREMYEQPDPLAKWKALKPGRKVLEIETFTVLTVKKAYSNGIDFYGDWIGYDRLTDKRAYQLLHEGPFDAGKLKVGDWVWLDRNKTVYNTCPETGWHTIRRVTKDFIILETSGFHFGIDGLCSGDDPGNGARLHFSPPTPPSREERIERAEKDLCSIFNVGENEHLCRQHISAILAELMEEKP